MEKKLFLSVIGALIHLAKHSRPQIANAVRESSKVMNGANKAAIGVVKNVLDIKNLGLTMKPNGDNNGPWDRLFQ